MNNKDNKDLGASGKSDRAVVNGAGQAVSALRASVPSALFNALGSLVSECADQRDIYPDDATALEAITHHINELYGCVEDGVFGRVTANPFPLADEAFHEALRRYPDAHGALIFLWGASGLGFREPTDEQLEWAREKAQAIEARRAETLGSVHESAVGAADAPNPSSTNGDDL